MKMKKGNEKKFDVDRLMASMELVVSHLKQGSEKGIRRYSIPSPPKTISSSEIKDIRMKLDVTQPVFAQLIGVSIATAKSWEMGRRAPNATARKLLHVASKNPFILMME
jgi:putative transcriptional regulator